MRQALAGLPLIILAHGISAQTPAAPPSTFAVASIKPATAADDRFMYRGLPGGELVATGVTLKFLIMEAFQVRAFEVSGADGWISSGRWDIQAKPEGVQGRLSSAQHAVMVRALLEDRFRLKVHRETKQMAVYALVVAKNGPKLSPAADPSTHGGKIPPGAWNMKSTTVRELAIQLSRQLSRRVIDRTGLDGLYDIELKWMPEEREGGPESLGLPPSPNNPAVSPRRAVHQSSLPFKSSLA